MSALNKVLREMKNLSYDPIEIKVREATNNDPIGASSTLMAEIAQGTYNFRLYPKLWAMVWKRLCDLEHILHVQKALILVEYLLRHGHDRFVADCKKQSNARDIIRLKKYKYFNKDHEDIAHDVRFKAAVVSDILMDDSKLSEERKKAERTRDIRLQALSSETVSQSPEPVPRKSSVETNWSSIAPAKKVAPKEAPPKETAPDDDDDPFGPSSGDIPTDEPAKEQKAAKVAKQPTKTTKSGANKSGGRKQVKKVEPPPEEPEENPEETTTNGDATETTNGETLAQPPQPAKSRVNPPAKTPATGTVAVVTPAPVPPVAGTRAGTDIDVFTNMLEQQTHAVRPVQQTGAVDLLTESSFFTAPTFVEVPAVPKESPNKGKAAIEKKSTPAKTGDAWTDLTSDLTNLDNLSGTPAKKVEAKQSTGVSMGQLNEMKMGLSLSDWTGQAPAPSPPAVGVPAAANRGSAVFNANNNPFFPTAPAARTTPAPAPSRPAAALDPSNPFSFM